MLLSCFPFLTSLSQLFPLYFTFLFCFFSILTGGEEPSLSSPPPPKKGSSRALCIVEGCTKLRQTNTNNMCASHYTESKKSGEKRKRERKDVAYEEVEVAVDVEFAPSPRAKRARRGRRSDHNLDGGPHKRPRGKAPAGKLWDSHHGAWIDE